MTQQNKVYHFFFLLTSLGMVFYSISDVTDKLLAPSSEGLFVPMLQEGFWASSIQLESTDPLNEILEGLCPSAMAIFDLAATQCHLWKTCKQLLETAERRLHTSTESKGRFPASIQWIEMMYSCHNLYLCHNLPCYYTFCPVIIHFSVIMMIMDETAVITG